MGLPYCDLLECLDVYVVPVLSHLEKPLWDGLREDRTGLRGRAQRSVPTYCSGRTGSQGIVIRVQRVSCCTRTGWERKGFLETGSLYERVLKCRKQKPLKGFCDSE